MPTSDERSKTPDSAAAMAPEYERPRLVEFGSLHDLTHGGGGFDDDQGGGPAS